jgi:hypothetical protein
MILLHGFIKKTRHPAGGTGACQKTGGEGIEID